MVTCRVYLVLESPSLQPDVQSKVKQEIATHLERYGKITYENLSELKYMMMVCQGKLPAFLQEI